MDIASIMIHGVPIDPNAAYRVTVNSFLADGGDGFTVLTQVTNRLGGEVDTDAFEKYFASNSPVEPGPQNRITQIPTETLSHGVFKNLSVSVSQWFKN